MSKKPINIYWCPVYIPGEDDDWGFLYPKPQTLYSELHQNKNKNLLDKNNSYLLCPAVGPKFKKTLVLRNEAECSYKYSVENNQRTINNLSDRYITAQIFREPMLNTGPTLLFSLAYNFFADEPLMMSVTPPMFHKPRYMNYGSMIPGEFDIGRWFRPVNFEVQTWSNNGEFHLENGEPIMYIEFKTDRPILLHRFNLNMKLSKYQKIQDQALSIYGPFQPLVEKYQKFMQSGFREKVLTEIKNNLVEDEPYKF